MKREKGKRMVEGFKIGMMVLLLCMMTTMISFGSMSVQKETITYRSISIFVNGVEIAPCDVAGNSTEPFIRNLDESTYLPVRALSGALGLMVDWDDASSTVILTSNGEVLRGEGMPVKTERIEEAELTCRDITITLDGMTVELKNEKGEAVEPFIKGDSTYIPMRAVASALGCTVGWDDATSSVLVTNNNDPREVDDLSQKGDIVLFGNYEQDNNLENGKEPIEWIVLEKEGNRVLLLSKYGLDAKEYHGTNTSITWQLSSVREWLNSEFLNEAFSRVEKLRIPVTKVENPDSYWGFDKDGNSIENNTGEGIADLKYQVSGGEATEDQVFLLSLDQVKGLMNEEKQTLNKKDGTTYEGNPSLQTSATAYAIAKGVSVSDYLTEEGEPVCWWWLRSQGYGSYLASCVDSIGGISARSVNRDCYAVRPAVWVDVESSR